MTLGERIKELRLQHGFTQRQLADAAGLDFTYVSKIENNKLEHTPSLKMLQTLARVLSTDELELLELADKVPPILRDIAQNREALQFMRKASRMVKTSQDWRSLTKHLNELHGLEPDSEKDAEA